MKTYNEFKQKKGRLYIETNGDEDVEWKLTLDISEIWNKYKNNELQLKDFNNSYYNKIVENNENLKNISDDCWSDISSEINKLKENTNKEISEKIYNKLYDIYDNYEILLKTNIQND